MTLLDRYLHAVRRHLPRHQRDDIAAELRDELLSQIEAEEAVRGRALNDDEVGVILKRCGRPTTVAARYGASNYLIGPASYPALLVALKLLAWVVLPIAAVSVIVTLATSHDPLREVAVSLFRFAVMGLANFAIITLVFMWIERTRVNPTTSDDWDPRGLPGRDVPEPTPRSEAISGFLLMTFYLLLWIGVLPVRSWISTLNAWFGGYSLPYGFAPIWDAVTPILVAVMITSMVRDVVAIARPECVSLRAYAGVGLHAGALSVLFQLLAADALFVVTDPVGLGAAHIGHFNMLFFMNLTIATAGVCISAALAVRRLMRQRTAYA